MRGKFFWSVVLTGLLIFGVFGAVKKYAVVSVSAANVRAQASSSAQVVYVARGGEKLLVLGKVRSWYRVRTASGIEGYIWENLVRIEEEETEEGTRATAAKSAVQPAEKPEQKPQKRKGVKLAFKMEVAGGYAFVSPADLNLFSEMWEKTFKFYYEDQYAYKESIGDISDVELTKEGEMPKVKSVIPFGGTLKLVIGRNFAVGLGLNYFSKTCSDSVFYEVSYQTSSGSDSFTRSSLPEFTLSLSAVNPYLSLHYLVPELFYMFGNPGGVELYAAAGMIFAKFSASQTWNYEVPGLELQSKYSWEGNGKGFGFNFGARGNFPLSEKAGFFLAFEYMYGKVNKLTGTTTYDTYVKIGSREVRSSGQHEGDWFVIKSHTSEAWGVLDIYYPVNDSALLSQKLRDFILDLSAPRILFGIYIEF